MRKITTIVLIAMTISGCGRKVTDKYTVDKVSEPYGPICHYELHNIRSAEGIDMQDSIGKYNVGDTVQLSISKVKQ